VLLYSSSNRRRRRDGGVGVEKKSGLLFFFFSEANFFDLKAFSKGGGQKKVPLPLQWEDFGPPPERQWFFQLKKKEPLNIFS